VLQDHGLLQHPNLLDEKIDFCLSDIFVLTDIRFDFPLMITGKLIQSLLILKF